MMRQAGLSKVDMVANKVADMVAVILSDFHSVNISELTKLFWTKVFSSRSFYESKLFQIEAHTNF